MTEALWHNIRQITVFVKMGEFKEKEKTYLWFAQAVFTL